MQRISYFLLIILTLSLSSCELIGDIFKAGVWAGLLLVAAIIAIVIWIISRFRK
jgi:TRAP-type C4-dicarboxylate transport system permease large subunit